MPTEFRFDDLDLREEPADSESKSGEMDAVTYRTCSERCTGVSCYC
jgi:hypothetical protein